jgi:DNA-binding MarR family transcriptional regulator
MSSTRPELLAALSDAMREMSGLGVLFSEAAARRLGLNTTDLECMGFLAGGPMTAGALAEATGLTSGAITGVADRLERAGYARREPDAIDRRKVTVRLTELAATRSAPIFGPMEAAMIEALQAYSDQELELLLAFTGRMREAGMAVINGLRN